MDVGPVKAQSHRDPHMSHRLNGANLGFGGRKLGIVIFTNSAPLGRVGHRVAMSVCVCVCLSVCLRHRVQFFF